MLYGFYRDHNLKRTNFKNGDRVAYASEQDLKKSPLPLKAECGAFNCRIFHEGQQEFVKNATSASKLIIWVINARFLKFVWHVRLQTTRQVTQNANYSLKIRRSKYLLDTKTVYQIYSLVK